MLLCSCEVPQQEAPIADSQFFWASLKVGPPCSKLHGTFTSCRDTDEQCCTRVLKYNGEVKDREQTVMMRTKELLG